MSRYIIRALRSQVDALNIRLPKKAQCRQRVRLSRYLQQVQRAFVQGEWQNGEIYLGRVAQTGQSLKGGQRISATDADRLLSQIQDLISCQR